MDIVSPLSVRSWAEVIAGIGILPRAKANRDEWERLRGLFDYYELTGADAIAAGELRIQLRRIGRQLATIDAFIAVTCLHHNLTLLTTNLDFEAVPDLARENWR